MKVSLKSKPGTSTQSSYKTDGYTHLKTKSGNIKILYTNVAIQELYKSAL